MSRIPVSLRLAAPVLVFASSVACDYTGDWLFPIPVENMPGVQHIFNEDGGELLVPITAESDDEIRAGTIYGEIGPTGSSRRGGSTFNFLGTGGPVCIFTDPETVFWNWSVAPDPSTQQKIWNYPDNVFDDGDIDLFVGLSVYYTGSPGVEIGDFFVGYTDSLGNDVPVELSECTNIGYRDQTNAHAGRGFPEMCGIDFTIPNVSYTGLLQTFSTPLDDDRLGYGLIVFDGTCDRMLQLATGVAPGQNTDPSAQECVITGESIVPRPIEAGKPTYCTGDGCLDAWAGSIEFESEFCLGAASDMRKFCLREASDKFDAGIDCQLELVEDIDARCYCGEISDLPVPGAL